MKARTIALVSGKGGSGKTMIATAMGLQFGSSDHNLRIILIDADTATAGMSYYLGLKEVQNTRTGLSSLSLEPEKYDDDDRATTKLLQPIRSYRRPSPNSAGWLRFLPVGDHRKINREYQRPRPESSDRTPLAQILKKTVQKFQEYADVLIVDCRGGIDDESLAVCDAVDDIILIVEPDTTSFQASRYLVDVLSEVDLAYKLRGFVINKVYSNPESIIRSGDFGTQFLAAIPLDISASRSFLVGDAPSRSSIFSRHVEQALSRAYPDQIPPPHGRIWGPRDYDRPSVFNIFRRIIPSRD